MPRGVRSSSCAPASRSSVAIWRDTAGWVKLSASAAAEIEPRSATARKTLRRAASNMTAGYTFTTFVAGAVMARVMRLAYGRHARTSFALMPAERHHRDVTQANELLHRTIVDAVEPRLVDRRPPRRRRSLPGRRPARAA
jgi:hypothetical protein